MTGRAAGSAKAATKTSKASSKAGSKSASGPIVRPASKSTRTATSRSATRAGPRQPTPIGPDECAPPNAAAQAATGLPFETVALVLQGGGALGSYQAGVVQGLTEAGIHCNWIAGISIGAFNTAIIAGNPPETRVARLREFWETICRPSVGVPSADWMQNLIDAGGAQFHRVFSAFEASRAIVEGQRGFFTPRGLLPWLGTKQSPLEASFYDTAQLRETLTKFVDFDRINEGHTRVSIGVVNVETGNFEYFENHGRHRRKLRAEHFMASGALPPGFPAIEVDKKFYWDGGLVSNTPLSQVLEATPRRNTLAFQVDVWSAIGRAPDTVYEAQERMKDIQYSSRTRAITNQMAADQHRRRLLREVLDKVPAAIRDTDPWCIKASEYACSRQVSVIHLIYEQKEWEGLGKDYEFSPQTMNTHWTSGLDDIKASLAHDAWLRLPPDGKEFVTHDRHRADR